MSRTHAQIMILFDLAIVSACFFIGYGLRAKMFDLYPLENYIILLPVLLLIWGSLLYHYFANNNTFRVGNVTEIFFSIFKTAVLGFIAFGGFTYFFKLNYISRSLMLLIFFLSAVLIAVDKLFLLYFLRVIRSKGYNTRNMLVVGCGKRAQQFIDLINRNGVWGYKIVGVIDDDPENTGQQIRGHAVMGTFSDIPEIVHNNVIDEVVFIVPRSWLGKIEEVMLFCENEGINVNLAVDVFELKFSHAQQTEMDGFPLLSFKTTTDKLWHLILKRAFDFAATSAALVVLSPVFLAVALCVKFTSNGPIFFRQERVGLHGRKFILYKFRTMVTDAEALLAKLMAKNEMSGPAFKMENDPRVTRIGRFLRKYSIDELPQLWNVFVGDMSLVGPRPPIPSEVNLYDGWHRRRLSMKPGITCLWQVNGRNKITDFNEWVKLDLEYIDNWSLWLEFKILMKTIPAVIFGAGAK